MDKKDMSKTAIILDGMIGRRTNHDIEIMLNRYLGDRISVTEYDYLFRKMLEEGVEADEIHENYCLDGQAWIMLKRRKKAYRKNKQKKSRGKPKRKR